MPEMRKFQGLLICNRCVFKSLPDLKPCCETFSQLHRFKKNSFISKQKHLGFGRCGNLHYRK